MSYLPNAHGGYLPYWHLFTSAITFASLPQFYTKEGVEFCKTLFNGAHASVTQLLSRQEAQLAGCFAVLRLIAAYNINNPFAYWGGFASFAIMCTNLGPEAFVFKTINLNKFNSVQALNAVFAVPSVLWIIAAQGHYLGSALNLAGKSK